MAATKEAKEYHQHYLVCVFFENSHHVFVLEIDFKPPTVQTIMNQIIIVIDQEPPTFNSTCPASFTLYTPNEYSVRLPTSFKLPTATDNAKRPSVSRTGFPADSFFPVGTTVVTYTAVDDAGLSASCTFSVTVVSK